MGLSGLTHKKSVDDVRESPALRVLERLRAYGADTAYYDPYIRSFTHHGREFAGLNELTEKALGECDLVIVTTAHTNVDYDFVAEHAKLILDTKNAMKNVKCRDCIQLL